MEFVVIWSELENSPPKREASELQPVAALARNAATRTLPVVLLIFDEILKRMTRPT
jgi:hypothetical protein